MTDDLFNSGLPAPAPPSRPLEVKQASGLAGLIQGADAEAELVRGVLEHQLVLTSRATKALAFLYAYGLGDMAQVVMELRRYHQRPSVLVKALEAVSLKSFMGRLDVILGNK